MPSDCQLDPPLHTRNASGTSSPMGCGIGIGGNGSGGSNLHSGMATGIISGCDSRRQSPQFMSDPPDIDDTDPDVIPNQYGKLTFLFSLRSFSMYKFFY